jgi:hypothetical protein
MATLGFPLSPGLRTTCTIDLIFPGRGALSIKSTPAVLGLYRHDVASVQLV